MVGGAERVELCNRSFENACLIPFKYIIYITKNHAVITLIKTTVFLPGNKKHLSLEIP